MAPDERGSDDEDPTPDGEDVPSEEDNADRQFDLVERTARFGEAIIAFAKKIPVNPVTRPLIPQLVSAGTSVGANYSEADDAESKRDFRHKIGICRKEARESKHWLRMVACAVPTLKDDARPLWQEAKELHLIFATIFRNTRVQ